MPTTSISSPVTTAAPLNNNTNNGTASATRNTAATTALLHFFFSIFTYISDAVPLTTLYIVAGALAFFFILILLIGLCCCQTKARDGYDLLDTDDDDAGAGAAMGRAITPAQNRKGVSPFDALHLKKANVQPVGESSRFIPDPIAAAANPAAVALLPPPLSPHEILSTTSLPAKFHRREEPPLAGIDTKSGYVKVIFNYRPNSKKMFIFVDSADELPPTTRAGYTRIQVRISLLPAKKQKFKTKWASCSKEDEGDPDEKAEVATVADAADEEGTLLTRPTFRESFTCRGIAPEDATNYGIQLRVFAGTLLGNKKNEKMLGECVRSFAAVNLEEETEEKLILEPRSAIAMPGEYRMIKGIDA